jgi:hypothetical protein
MMPLVRVLPFLLLAVSCAETPMVAPGGSTMPRPSLDDDDLLAMVPAEADLVLWADMAKLRTSPWTRDSFAKVVSADSGASEPEFDQIRDVERLVFAKVPALRDGASLLVAQGKFDRERMSKDFAKDGGAVEKSAYRGADMLVRGDEALAFLSNRTVISGLTVAVRTAIDCNIGVARSIDSDSWFQRLRARLTRTKGTPPVAALYVQLQPATREALLREMGEGEALEEFAGRIDLGSDLDVTAIGSVRTALQARDLAARLAERVRDARSRPIVAAFGFTSVLDSMRFSAKETDVEVTLHISQQERVEISERMAIVAETVARMRKTPSKEKSQP